MSLTRRAALVLPLASPLVARAQTTWRPTQQVRIVVPAAPGGTADISGRLLAPWMQQELGQPCVVDNRSGAGGVIGTMEVLRTPPDGHNLLLGNIGPQAIAYSLVRDLPYRAEQILPVGGIVRGPNVLVVHPSIPARTVPEFVALLKRRPGELSYGSPGIGQSPHLTGLWFNQATGTEAIHVPYRGAGPAMVELVAGNIQYMWDNLTSGIQQVRAGQVRALAVSSAERTPQLPDVPAARETMPELAEFDVNTWFGVFAPAGTPRPVIETVSGVIAKMQAADATKARIAQMSGTALPADPEGFARFVTAETAKWGAVVRRAGLQVDAN